MDSLFKMAVETLFLYGNSFEEFQKLPEQLKLYIIITIFILNQNHDFKSPQHLHPLLFPFYELI